MSDFTDRFMKIPIYVVNMRSRDIKGDDHESDMARCIAKINPRRIEAYSETIPQKDFDPANKIWTNVMMESGDTFIVRIPLEKFEKLINDHQSQ